MDSVEGRLCGGKRDGLLKMKPRHDHMAYQFIGRSKASTVALRILVVTVTRLTNVSFRHLV